MTKLLNFSLIAFFIIVFLGACQAQGDDNKNESKNTSSTTTVSTDDPTKVVKSDTEWQTCLTAEQYKILREKGTERAFTGAFYDHHEKGIYYCAGCKSKLFTSEAKFDSGTGWPSYFQPIHEKSVKIQTDKSYGMVRKEVLCAKCDGHLGHVFDDGPEPTGLRYCINSASLGFEKSKK